MKKTKLMILLFSVLSLSSVSAQVTIGSNISPNEGSLLDMKENANLGANATKGLGMPRVHLKMLKGDLGETLGQTSGTLNATDHTALLVYNIAECVDGNRYTKGLHLWNSTQWEPLIPYSDPLWMGSTLTGRSGTKYKTLTFGTAGEWMIEDLKETQYDTNETQNTIPAQYGAANANMFDVRGYYFPSPITHNGTVAHDRTWFDTYKDRGIGLVYTWGAVTNGKYTDLFTNLPTHSYKKSYVQGLCPNGWVVPSDYDQTLLEKEIISNYQLYSSGAAPEPWNNDWWENDAPVAHQPRGTHSTNMKTPCVTPGYLNPSKGTSLETGFNAMLSGYISYDGIQVLPGANSHLWSSSAVEYGSYRAYYRYFNSNAAGYADAGVGRFPNIVSYMFNVRCKKSPDTRISTIRGISGRTYLTSDFGAAGVWMIENLDETQYDDGTAQPLTQASVSAVDGTTKAYYYPIDKNPVNNPTTDRVWYDKNKNAGLNVGLLYTWQAASKGQANENLLNTTDVGTTKSNIQGICPKGWVLPSDYDMALLEKEMTENATQYGSFVLSNTTWNPSFNSSYAERGEHGANMRSPQQVLTPAIVATLNGKSYANGFNMLMVGILYNNTTSLNGNNMHFWSATTLNGTSSYYRYSYANNPGLGRTINSHSLMFSVRCKKAGS